MRALEALCKIFQSWACLTLCSHLHWQTCVSCICMIRHQLLVYANNTILTNELVSVVFLTQHSILTFISFSIPIKVSSTQFPLSIIWFMFRLDPTALPSIWNTLMQPHWLLTGIPLILVTLTPGHRAHLLHYLFHKPTEDSKCNYSTWW